MTTKAVVHKDRGFYDFWTALCNTSIGDKNDCSNWWRKVTCKNCLRKRPKEIKNK